VRIIIIAIEPLNCSALVGAFACLKFGQSRIAPAMWCPPQVRQMTTNIILLDSLLAEYGGDARVPRELLRRVVVSLIDRVWHHSRINVAAPFEASSEAEALSAQIQRLSPQTEAQHSLHGRIMKITTEMWRTRLLLFTEKDEGPSDAIFGGAGILAHHHFCKFQFVRTAQSNGDRRIAHPCAVSNRSNLLDFRAESAL
jgi:hypothetical protein